MIKVKPVFIIIKLDDIIKLTFKKSRKVQALMEEKLLNERKTKIYVVWSNY